MTLYIQIQLITLGIFIAEHFIGVNCNSNKKQQNNAIFIRSITTCPI